MHLFSLKALYDHNWCMVFVGVKFNTKSPLGTKFSIVSTSKLLFLHFDTKFDSHYFTLRKHTIRQTAVA